MKSSPLLTVALLSLGHFAEAQTVVTPTGAAIGGTWGGWSIDGEQTGSGPGTATRHIGLDTVGEVKNATGTFYAPDGYIVDPAWSGDFGITGEKTSGSGTGTSASLVFSPDSSGAGYSVIDSIQSLSYISYNTSANPVEFNFDFSTLDSGFLPKGTLIHTSGRYNLGLALTISSDVTTPFLDYLSDQSIYGLPNAAISEVVFNAGSYTFEITSQTDPSVSNNGAPGVFVTTEDLTSLKLISTGGDAFAVFIAPPLITVPEPSGVMLIALSGVGIAARRKRISN